MTSLISIAIPVKSSSKPLTKYRNLLIQALAERHLHPFSMSVGGSNAVICACAITKTVAVGGSWVLPVATSRGVQHSDAWQEPLDVMGLAHLLALELALAKAVPGGPQLLHVRQVLRRRGRVFRRFRRHVHADGGGLLPLWADAHALPSTGSTIRSVSFAMTLVQGYCSLVKSKHPWSAYMTDTCELMLMPCQAQAAPSDLSQSPCIHHMMQEKLAQRIRQMRRGEDARRAKVDELTEQPW